MGKSDARKKNKKRIEGGVVSPSVKLKETFSYTPLPKATFKNEWVVSKKSKVAGLGVFAKKFIPAGTKIQDYYGEEMSWRDFTTKYSKYKENSFFTYPMRRVWRIIVAKERPYLTNNITNYINEIPDNVNVELKQRALYAKKDIPKGEELSLQYPVDYNRYWLAD